MQIRQNQMHSTAVKDAFSLPIKSTINKYLKKQPRLAAFFCISRLQQKTLKARLTLAPLQWILVSEAAPLAWYWLFSKMEVLLDCYQQGTLHSCRPVATLLWCKPRQSKRHTSIHIVKVEIVIIY
jgi:hypothetical protein